MIRTTLIALTLAAALLAGCGDDDSSSSSGNAAAMTSDTAMKGDAMKDDAMKSDTAMKGDGDAMKADAAMESDAAMATKGTGKVVKVVRSQFGRVIADGKGEAYYLFDKERTRKPRCYGKC